MQLGRLLRGLCVAVLYSASSPPAALADQSSFFKGLSGSWSGHGDVYVGKFGDVSVTCQVAIRGSESKIAMDGSCGKLAVRQRLALSLRSVGGNKYVGTYTGSRTGPAKLVGTLRGDRLVMSVRWGGVVNGDRTAQMVISRTGPHSFAQTVSDKVAGSRRSTSSLTFKRRL
jgi:hypothetical protein